jgi:hypothetical protein
VIKNLSLKRKLYQRKKMDEIKSDDGKTIAIVVKREFDKDGVNFISKEDYPLQLGISSYKKGATIKAHFHIEKEVLINKLQEVVHIKSGRTIVHLYDLNDEKFTSVELSDGDTIFFVDGGDGFEMLEDTKIIEVKQGPYSGKDKDKRMIE